MPNGARSETSFRRLQLAVVVHSSSGSCWSYERPVFVGWDVGAWNCDKNRRSRDALCVLTLRDSEPSVVGKPWRGNVRDVLVRHEGSALVEALLQRVEVDGDETGHVTIAIDAPLGWPRRAPATSFCEFGD